jgi:arabinofuranosyltransferase
MTTQRDLQLAAEQEGKPNAREVDPAPSWAAPPGTVGAIGLAVLVILAAWVYYLRAFYHDDAFIALRYSENWIAGVGLVWNPGEPVEGYTSLLWVLLTGALSAVGFDLVLTSRVLGLLSLLGLGAILCRQGGRAGFAAAALVLTSGPLIAWSIGGLESLLFSALITWAVLRSGELTGEERMAPFFTLGLLFALGQLCRPEGVLFFGIAFIYLALGWIRGRGPELHRLGAFILPFATLVGGHFLWRYSYYGEWLPNTAYVKGAISPASVAMGLDYLAEFSLHHGLLIAIMLYGLVQGQRLRGRDALIVACIAVYSSYVVVIGGGHMPWFRLFVPILPLLYLLAMSQFFAPRSGAARRSLLVWLGVVGLIGGAGAVSTLDLGETAGSGGWKHMDPAALNGRQVGLYIRRAWPKDSLVALNTAGSTVFYSKLRSIDMLGLNDHHIARRPVVQDPTLPWSHLPGHQKGDGSYVLDRKPDFIIIGGSQGSRKPAFISD